MAQIRESFVTPFDRSDIKKMTQSMQGLLEDMQLVARSHPGGATVNLDEYGSRILDCAGHLKTGISLRDHLDEQADALRRMRDDIAATYRQMSDSRETTVLGLFANTQANPVSLLADIRMLDNVSTILARFDNVADHIDDIVLDHV